MIKHKILLFGILEQIERGKSTAIKVSYGEAEVGFHLVKNSNDLSFFSNSASTKRIDKIEPITAKHQPSYLISIFNT